MNARPESTSATSDISDFGASRRQFLKTSGGLVLGFSLLGPMAALAQQPATRLPASATGGAQTFAGVDPARLDAWLAIHPDNTATLFTGKVEQGNGSPNALAQIAAEELDFPFDKLFVVMGTTTSTVDQGPTYGSMAVRYAGPQIRHAAAAGRQVLLSMASKRLHVPVEQLTVRDGVISVVGVPKRSVTYGELVDGKRLDMTIGATGKTFDMKVAPDAKLKDPSKYTIVGTSVPRKDIPGKVTGEFTYVHDVKVPGMLHGRVVRPYGIESDLLRVDESGLKDIPGFVAVVRRRNFLGVVAKTEWGAIKAAEKLGSKRVRKGPADGQAKWSDWQGLPATADDLWQTLRDASGKVITVAKRGDVDAALGKGVKTLKATYRTPFETHGSIGPELAIADVGKGYAKFWAGTQMPHQARRDMAELLDLPVENVEVNWVEASGQYGRNGLEPVMADAAIMSRAVGRPVRVQWMRWDSHGWDPKEPPIVQDLEGALDAAGNVVAWRHHMWVPTMSNTRLLASELIGKPVGKVNLGDAAIKYEYQFDNADVVAHGESRVGVITAWMRAPGQFETTFAMESFIDELAAAARQDPLAFRLKYLKEPRAIAVMEAAAKQYGWKSRPSFPGKQAGRKTTGRGIAWVNRDGSFVATIADVVVDRDTGGIWVKRVVVAHDCGLVISPDGMRNQIEGNVIQSISRTLHEEITFDRAHVTSRDWASYPILTFNEIPDSIEMVFVNNSAEYPSNGGGEPSTCPTAAVISNAVYDATGVRLRQKPFRKERVKVALARA